MFQYSNDTDSEILLRDSVVNRQELLDAFGNLPNTLNEGKVIKMLVLSFRKVIIAMRSPITLTRGFEMCF